MLTAYFAQKAFVLHNDSLLAVRRNAKDPHNPLRWEVPGGRLEAGEELDHHLIREVREETGITIIPGEPFYLWKWNIKKKTADAPDTIVAVARFCTAQTTELDSGGRMDDDDLDLMEWVPLAKLSTMDWIPNTKPVVEAFLARIEGSRK